MTGTGQARRDAAPRVRAPARSGRPGRRGAAAGWVVGAKSVLRLMAEGAAPPYVVVARDAPPDVVAPVLARARALSVAVVEAESAASLGATCGVARPVATAVPSEPAS